MDDLAVIVIVAGEYRHHVTNFRDEFYRIIRTKDILVLVATCNRDGVTLVGVQGSLLAFGRGGGWPTFSLWTAGSSRASI